MNRTKFVLATLLFLLPSPARAQTDITGDWDVVIQMMQGTNTVHVTFKQDGEKLSGRFKSQLGELAFDGGSVVGNDLTFGFAIPIQGQVLQITMTGRVDGASIAGKALLGGFGEGEWTAKRVEASAEAPSVAAAAAPTVAASAAPATGLSGKWDITIKTQMGDVPASAELSESAGRISGTINGPMGGAVDVSGTLEGNGVKLAFVAKTPQGDFPVSMTGELTGEGIVNGKAEFGGMGQGEWSARRKP
jgi:hypothetical protein